VKKIKILHIITSIDNGGAENHVVDLILDQVKIYDIYLIYFKGNDYHANQLKKNNVIVFKINFLKINFFIFFINFIKVLKIFKKINPQIVHCHLWISEIYGMLLKFFSNNYFSLIITKHLDSLILEASLGQKRFFSGFYIEKIIIRYADHLIFISESVRNYFISKFYINKKKYSIVKYGINSKKFTKLNCNKFYNLKKSLAITKNTYVIGCVARHVEQKNLNFLLKAFAKFTNDNSNIETKLIMIGKGNLTSDLKNLAINLGINNKIVWVSHTNNVNLYFKLFNVYCICSKYEGFGLVLLEALAFGLPIVATKSGSFPEIVINNRNGYLVDQNNIDNFSHRIKDSLRLIKTNNFKKKQQNYLNNNFSLKKVFLNTDKIYKLNIK
jgi:glycosyltransferase involved in cell wall biosynthesis